MTKMATKTVLMRRMKELPRARKRAEKAKEAWKAALLEEEKKRDSLKAKVRDAKGAMDAAYALLSDATQAKQELLTECTPLELRRAEDAAGAAHRVLEQRLHQALDDVSRFKLVIKGLDKRTRRDAETKERDADRLTYLESIVADVSEKEQDAAVRLRGARKELDDAYARAIKTDSTE